MTDRSRSRVCASTPSALGVPTDSERCFLSPPFRSALPLPSGVAQLSKVSALVQVLYKVSMWRTFQNLCLVSWTPASFPAPQLCLQVCGRVRVTQVCGRVRVSACKVAATPSGQDLCWRIWSAMACCAHAAHAHAMPRAAHWADARGRGRGRLAPEPGALAHACTLHLHMPTPCITGTRQKPTLAHAKSRRRSTLKTWQQGRHTYEAAAGASASRGTLDISFVPILDARRVER